MSFTGCRAENLFETTVSQIFPKGLAKIAYQPLVGEIGKNVIEDRK